MFKGDGEEIHTVSLSVSHRGDTVAVPPKIGDFLGG
jgi:hypothetical protein